MLAHIEYLEDLAKDSFAYEPLVNSFSVFETFDHILMIIYATRNNSIIILLYHMILLKIEK